MNTAFFIALICLSLLAIATLTWLADSEFQQNDKFEKYWEQRNKKEDN